MPTHALRLVLTSALVLGLAACGEAVTETVTSSVIASDQTPDPADVVIIDQVVAADAGWSVVHEDSDGGYGAVLGQTAVEAGEATDVAVTLSRTCADGETLHAMLHVDQGEEGLYEFPVEAVLPAPTRGVYGVEEASPPATPGAPGSGENWYTPSGR